MRTFIGMIFVLATLMTSASTLADPSDKAYKNANDNASFKKGGKHDDNDSAWDRLKEELDDDDEDKDKNKKKSKNKKK